MVSWAVLLSNNNSVRAYADRRFYESPFDIGPAWLLCLSGSEEFRPGVIHNFNDLRIVNKVLVF